VRAKERGKPKRQRVAGTLGQAVIIVGAIIKLVLPGNFWENYRKLQFVTICLVLDRTSGCLAGFCGASTLEEEK
jgi:hypothetical protein